MNARTLVAALCAAVVSLTVHVGALPLADNATVADDSCPDMTCQAVVNDRRVYHCCQRNDQCCHFTTECCDFGCTDAGKCKPFQRYVLGATCHDDNNECKAKVLDIGPASTLPRISHDDIVASFPLLTERAGAHAYGAAYMIGGYEVGNGNAEEVNMLLNRGSRVTVVTHLPARIRRATAAADYLGNIVVAGGLMSDGTPTGNTYRYDKISWTQGPPLPYGVARVHHTMTNICGIVYLVGGETELNMGSNYLFALVEEEWQVKNPCPVALYRHAAVETHAGELLVCGGIQDGHISERCYIYNPTSNKWRPVANMQQARAGHAMVRYNYDVYIVGGDGGEYIERHDPERGGTLLSVTYDNPNTVAVALGEYN